MGDVAFLVRWECADFVVWMDGIVVDGVREIVEIEIGMVDLLYSYVEWCFVGDVVNLYCF